MAAADHDQPVSGALRGFGRRLRDLARGEGRLGDPGSEAGGLVVGEGAEAPPRRRSGLIALDRSAIARKIILFNLLAMLTLVAGVLVLNPARESLAKQRERSLVSEARLLADGVGAALGGTSAPLSPSDEAAVADLLTAFRVPDGVDVHVFDPEDRMVAAVVGTAPEDPAAGLAGGAERTTILTGALNAVWERAARLLARDRAALPPSPDAAAFEAARATGAGETRLHRNRGAAGQSFTVVAPIRPDGRPIGSVAVTTGAGEIDRLARVEREQFLQMFVVAFAVSIGLSLVLASTIANPLSDLAAAAEAGRERDRKPRLAGHRVRIPDLSERPDEIGRLSGALRGLVGALYDRIESNEQFAADVAHEIKNPLASLGSAVSAMPFAKTDDQRRRLLGVIEHDVRRLDRLVSDISNASRLDSELVKNDEAPFDLVATVRRLVEYHAEAAAPVGVEVVTDLPARPVVLRGLEDRLAQVIVNLLTNALSFCTDGDAVRVWVRGRGGRVLLVVEDTGPGIPDAALSKVFERFYSERPEAQFGDHSGLGLAISRQIVEAHGGVIWAENIRPTPADPTSDPLGARFVVGLPA